MLRPESKLVVFKTDFANLEIIYWSSFEPLGDVIIPISFGS